MKTKLAAVAAFGMALGMTAPAFAQETIKIGVLNDMSSLFSDASGMGSVMAARLAIEDFTKENPNAGFKVEVVFADHQNKPDVGAAVSRKWYEAEKVDMVIDIPNSGVALAVSELARQFDKVVIISGAGATNLTGDKCNANTIHWTWDTYSTAQGAVKASAGPGADKWFLLTANYAFGINLEENAAAALRGLGYTVTGTARHPFNSSDFSSFVLQAQDSKANVLGFANAGGDFSSAAKQAVEYGLPQRGIRLAALWGGIMELKSLGLNIGQGLQFAIPFYWDANDKTRALNSRYMAMNNGKSMSEEQAGVYGGVLGFLRGAAANQVA